MRTKQLATFCTHNCLARMVARAALCCFVLQSSFATVIKLTDADIEQLNTVQQAIQAAEGVEGNELTPWPEELKALPELISESAEPMRWELSAVVAGTANSLPDGSPIQSYLAGRLVERLKDDSLRVRQAIPQWLLELPDNAFSTNDITAISDSFLAEPSFEGLILVGRLSYESISEQINELATPLFAPEESDKVFGTLSWAALLIQAREGIPASVDQLIRLLETHADEITRSSRLFGDLVIVHQPAVARYLQRYLMSDSRIESTKSSAPGRLIATYAAEALSKMLNDFPVKKAYSDYSMEEIEVCRNWISNQSSFEFSPL